MKTALMVVLALLLLTAVASADGIKQVDQPQGIPSFLGYVPDRLIVVMKPEVGELETPMAATAGVHIGDADFDRISDIFGVASITKQFKGAKLNEQRTADLARHYKVTIRKGNLESAMAAYRQDPLVERVEPIGIHAMYATPNDGYYDPYQWHLNQTNDHDIDAPEAWDIEVGQDNTIVAILDSGTRYYHPDLGGVNASPTTVGASRGNMWINNAELNGSGGVDDDGNGYTDDWIGYDFISSTTNCWPGEDCNTQDNDPRDFNGHGTHTSGIFGMITNDGYGMCGVAGGWGNGTQQEFGNGVKIMALRMGFSYNYLGQEYGVVYMDAAAEALYYAADNGAKIASCSWGSSNSGGIGTAATYFLNWGGIICVAAGNGSAEEAADYLNGRGDCISVAATDENDDGASFTTYGTWVDISAPGNNIYSTFHDHTDPNTNYWAAMGGTSMATPMVAGTAALIWSQNPSWTAAQVTSQLYSSTDNIDAYLSSKYIGKMGIGRINAYNAVNTGPPPPPVANFSGSPISGTEPLTVNFTDLSTGSITTWDWTFGDGGTSTAQNPSYEYLSAGTYTVTLTVTGPGGSDGETKTNYITVDPCVPPVANFSGAPVSGTAALGVSFTDLSTGNPTSWDWDFGDGSPNSTAQSPSHTYATAGDYTVTLTATNACGSDAEQKLNYIHVDPSVSEKAFALSDIPVEGTVSGSYTDTYGPDDVYETLTEIASSGHPRKTTSTLEHKWDFNLGGGGTGTTFNLEAFRPNNADGDNFIFEYSTDDVLYNPLVTVASATEQTYSVAVPDLTGTVYVRVTDSDGAWRNSSNDPVNIDYMYFEYSTAPAPPVADFAGSPTSGVAPLTVNFTDLSTGSPTSWDWDFGDASPHSSTQNPSHEYASIGLYTVTLTATNAYGSDGETKVDYISVFEGGNDMHVENMAVGRAKSGPNYFGTCTVTIYDNVSQPVSGATVSVTATGPTGGNYNGVTAADGTIDFQTSGMKKPSGEWCFEVTNVTHASYTYNSGANNVTYACESGWVYSQDNPTTLLTWEVTGLAQNHPNPFNAGTNITFSLPESGEVDLQVYNVLGQSVRSLASGEYPEGTHTIQFDGTDNNGRNLASGMYFYRLTTRDLMDTKKMILLK